MTTEQLPPQDRAPQRWTGRRTLAAVAIAVAVAGAGGAAIYVARTSDTASAQTGMQGGPSGGQGNPGQSTLSSALHGEYVVADGNGGYTTEVMQVGTVTEISSTSLTAKSTDGYTKTYTVGSSTAVGDDENISSIVTGDTVTVLASVSGETVTAEKLTEGTEQAGQVTGGASDGHQQQGTLPRQDSSQSGSGQTTGQA